MGIALVFVGIFTPWEVAFLDAICFDVLFWWNRVIDCIFLVDIALQFVLIKEVETPSGMVTESARACRYYNSSS